MVGISGAYQPCLAPTLGAAAGLLSVASSARLRARFGACAAAVAAAVVVIDVLGAEAEIEGK